MLRPRRPRRGLWIAGMLLVGVLAACANPSTEATRSPPVATDAPPAAAYFSDPLLAHVRLSPDGERVVGVATRDATRMLVERPVRGGEVHYLDKFDDPATRIAAVGWAGNTIVVVGVGGRERVLGIDRRVVDVHAFDLAPFRPLQIADATRLRASPRAAPFLHWLPDDPDRVLVNEGDPDGSVHPRRVSVRTGVGADVTPEGFVAEAWYADRRGVVRAAHVRDPDGLTMSAWARVASEDAFVALSVDDFTHESSLAFAGFSEDPRSVYVYGETESGRRGVYAYDLVAQQRGALLAADEDFDATRLVHAPGTERLVAVEFGADPPTLHFLGSEAEAEQASIDATFPGTRNRIVDASRDGTIALLEVSSDTQPPEVYVFDREKREMDLLYQIHPDLDVASLATRSAVTYPARDGVAIHAYLTRPRGAASEALPVIVIPHDGPTERDVWGWDARAQFFASRGFAVFQPNYRGSRGYGRDFERSGYAGWGAAMQDDVVDGVAWLVAEGVADPDRVGIFGAGYGGYVALIAPVLAPGVFRAVASWGGISDLVDLVENPQRHGATDPNTPIVWAAPRDVDRLAGISPLQRAEGIGVPVLLGHGALDATVSVTQTRAIAEALEQAGRPAEVHIYRDAGKSFHAASDRIAFHETLAAFFARHLAPRPATEGVEPL